LTLNAVRRALSSDSEYNGSRFDLTGFGAGVGRRFDFWTVVFNAVIFLAGVWSDFQCQNRPATFGLPPGKGLLQICR
jgi:hypothetical protein